MSLYVRILPLSRLVDPTGRWQIKCLGLCFVIDALINYLSSSVAPISWTWSMWMDCSWCFRAVGNSSVGNDRHFCFVLSYSLLEPSQTIMINPIRMIVPLTLGAQCVDVARGVGHQYLYQALIGLLFVLSMSTTGPRKPLGAGIALVCRSLMSPHMQPHVLNLWMS